MKRTYAEKLLRSREIMLDLLKCRGYKLVDSLEEDPERPMENERMKEIFQDIDNTHSVEPYTDELIQTYEKVTAGSIPKIWVMWMGDLAVGKVYTIYQKIKDEDIKHLILVIDTKITCKARETLQSIKKVDHLRLEIFYISNLQYNPTKHDLVPHHRVCSAREKEGILLAYGVKPHQLPKIRLEDIVAKFIGANKGNVVEIKIPIENPYSEGFLKRFPEKRDKKYYDITYRLVV